MKHYRAPRSINDFINQHAGEETQCILSVLASLGVMYPTVIQICMIRS